jgi:hypothetical protein
MAFAAGGAFAAAAPVPGFQVHLDLQPGWTISGVWSHDGQELLLVDALRGEILRFSPRGELLGQIEVPLRGSTEVSRPSNIHLWGDGYLVEQEDGDFVELGSSLEILDEVDLLEKARQPGGAVASVFGWVPLGRSLVTISDVRLADGGWNTGFLRVPLAHPSEFEVLQDLSGEGPAAGFYLLGQPYLAAVGGRAYFLTMSASPSICEVTAEAGEPARLRRLGAFPAAFASRPLLPEQTELSQIPALFEGVERSHMAAGLYGWGDYLFVLTRRPGAVSGKTRWSLTQIDPRRDEIVRTFDLPTTAPHLTVIPGDASWALLEKGHIRGFGQQDISTLLVIPSSYFEN